MQNWGVLILVVAVFVANLPTVMAQWRSDRQGSIKTLWLMGAYALYVALGLALLLLLAPAQGGASDGKALLLTGVMVGWIFYGAHSDAGRAALPRAARLADALRHRRSFGARPHVRLPRRLSVGLTCSLIVLARGGGALR